MNSDIQLIGINEKFNIEPLSFNCVLHSLLLHHKLISFNSNWLVIWSPFFLLIPISCISAFILGHFRYQLFQLPVTFMGALFYSQCEVFLHGLKIFSISSWMKIDSWPLQISAL